MTTTTTQPIQSRNCTAPQCGWSPVPHSHDLAIEYALMIDWQDGQPVEYVPAKSAEHAEHMAVTIYQGRTCWTVGREVQPWRYVRRSDAELGDEVAR